MKKFKDDKTAVILLRTKRNAMCVMDVMNSPDIHKRQEN